MSTKIAHKPAAQYSNKQLSVFVAKGGEDGRKARIESAKRIKQLTTPAVFVQKVPACPTCGAKGAAPCVTRTGNKTHRHLSRLA